MQGIATAQSRSKPCPKRSNTSGRITPERSQTPNRPLYNLCMSRLRAVALLCLLFNSKFAAQTPDTATLSGTVLDPSRAAVPDAEVTVTNTATKFHRSVTTDARGNFFLSGLPI